MEKITVHASGTYDILIDKGSLSGIGQALRERFRPCTIAILSDDKVFTLYGKTVMDSLQKAGFTTVSHVIENGEQSKTLAFSKATGATYAGKHTETLTFGIKVE